MFILSGGHGTGKTRTLLERVKAEDGIIVCEVDNNYLKEDHEKLEIIKNRKYGDKSA